MNDDDYQGSPINAFYWRELHVLVFRKMLLLAKVFRKVLLLALVFSKKLLLDLVLRKRGLFVLFFWKSGHVHGVVAKEV